MRNNLRGPVATVEGVGKRLEKGLAQHSLRPAVARFEAYSRMGVSFSNVSALVSGRLHMVAIFLPAEETITSAAFVSGGTAMAGQTNWWFALYDPARNLLRQTADQGATAWAANTPVALAFTSTYRTQFAGIYYVGIMVAATTVPTLAGYNQSSIIGNLAPITAGTSTTGLTTTAPNPANALSVAGQVPYCFVA